jgi:hypothetical protein
MENLGYEITYSVWKCTLEEVPAGIRMMCWGKNTDTWFWKERELYCTHVFFLQLLMLWHPPSCAKTCKHTACAHRCYKIAIRLLVLDEVHCESGKGQMLSCRLQISVVTNTDLCSRAEQSVGRFRDTVAHRVAAQMVIAFTGGECTIPLIFMHLWEKSTVLCSIKTFQPFFFTSLF